MITDSYITYNMTLEKQKCIAKTLAIMNASLYKICEVLLNSF
jgi:hypothetical protein